PRAEALRLDAILSSPADLNICADREDRLLRGAYEKLVFCAKLQIPKAAGFLFVFWIQIHEIFAQFDAEIWCNAFCDFHRDGSLASFPSFDCGDCRKRQFVVHERIVCRKRGGEKTRACKTVTRCRLGEY